jgi:hypothetical protein
MGLHMRKLKAEEVQEELLYSGNARNQKIVKVLAPKCLEGDHDKLKVVFSTASLCIRDSRLDK